jgi:succinyl-CoA synthetase beta subunit
MDLLEYQGKQLFRKHAVPTPEGRHADREVVALDAKVTIDGSALYRHPDVAEMRDVSAEDPQERMAKERGLTYVKVDGNVGILGNGAEKVVELAG